MLLLVITAYHAMAKEKRLCAHGRPIVNRVYDYFTTHCRLGKRSTGQGALKRTLEVTG